MKRVSFICRPWILVALLLVRAPAAFAQPRPEPPSNQRATKYDINNCVNEFKAAAVESTKVGYQYWFVDRKFADGKTLKLSVVRPHSATHPPHRHGEDEFFFVLEGKAELVFDGKSRVVGPNTSFYCPANSEHGIRNVGETDLRYLVIKRYGDDIDLSSFWDSAHHWYDIHDEDQVIEPHPDRPQFQEGQTAAIAENILLYQKENGGWPKNYDMRAILSEEQKQAVRAAKTVLNTTFDNGATYSHIEFLAKIYATDNDPRFKDACLKGLDFVLQAQYPNGGWPQFYPDAKGYAKYITFNDGAMIGVMKVLQQVVQGRPWFSFVDNVRRDRIRDSFERGLACILRCQIREKETLTVWCQQHDNVDLRPQSARKFEPASLCSQESAEIVTFLMSLDRPGPEVIAAVKGAVQWFRDQRLQGIVVRTVDAPPATYQYHSTSIDRVVQQDPTAPPIWARFYELGTGRPLFCNRDGLPVYSLAQVERERRTGYAWYNYAPEQVLGQYVAWEERWGRSSRGDS